VLVGGSPGWWIDGLARAWQARLLSPFVRQRLLSFMTRWNRQELILLRDLIETGKVVPVIDRTCPLSEAAEAMRYLETGRARGKIVITV
jgi:NADPH:quinone reductase-like Zn-dependent oxidoreductase